MPSNFTDTAPLPTHISPTPNNAQYSSFSTSSSSQSNLPDQGEADVGITSQQQEQKQQASKRSSDKF